MDALNKLLIDGVDKLLTRAEQLSHNNPRLGALMLLTAAASLAPDRAALLAAANEAFDMTETKQ